MASKSYKNRYPNRCKEHLLFIMEITCMLLKEENYSAKEGMKDIKGSLANTCKVFSCWADNLRTHIDGIIWTNQTKKRDSSTMDYFKCSTLL